MFNEKIFIFFWFWFLLVGALSVLSLLYWLFATVLPGKIFKEPNIHITFHFAGQQRGYVSCYVKNDVIIISIK